MNKFAFLLLIPLLMIGCAGQPRIIPESPPTATAAQKSITQAQEIVAQGTAALLKAQKLLDAEIDTGVMTKIELTGIQDQLKKGRAALDKANGAIKTGNIADAIANALDADALASAAESFLAKRIAERRKKT